MKRQAAEGLCYTEELWDGLSVDDWTHCEKERPCFRFRPYDYLDLKTQFHALVMDYSRSTWNSPGRNKIEKLAFHDISDSQQEAATAIGFTEESYNCWVNHYIGFGWDELASQGMQIYWVYLGWNSDMWDQRYDKNGDKPRSEWKYFYDLSELEVRYI